MAKRWNARLSRSESPLLNRDRLKAFRHTLFQAGVEFQLITEAPQTELRTAQGVVNQQATEEAVQAFLTVVSDFKNLLASMIQAQNYAELNDRWQICRTMRDLQKTLIDLAQRVGWTATLRETEIGNLIRECRIQLQALKDQAEGTSNTEAEEALTSLERVFEKMQKGRDQSKKSNEDLLTQGDQQRTERDAYVQKLEDLVNTLRQELANQRQGQGTDSRNLPYPTPPKGKQPGKQPGQQPRQGPPNARRQRRTPGR